MLRLDGGAVTCLSIHASDQMGIMVGDLADSATLGGSVALSTSGTRAISGSRLRKSNSKLSGVIQTMMVYEEFDEATVAYIVCIFIINLLSYLLSRLLPFPGEILVIRSNRVHIR